MIRFDIERGTPIPSATKRRGSSASTDSMEVEQLFDMLDVGECLVIELAPLEVDRSTLVSRLLAPGTRHLVSRTYPTEGVLRIWRLA